MVNTKTTQMHIFMMRMMSLYWICLLIAMFVDFLISRKLENHASLLVVANGFRSFR